ncbi:oxidoreductase FAD/FMN-binding protein [Salinisphaera sp. PC39]|uniref:NADH:flavin oxidoreductase/NADH oxidase family protein n=1 Tax=Salinisphaera sp. PC39 TaxID=1304156 RepID=UPI00333F39DC
MADVLNTPLRLPCGETLPNRLAKAGMTEGLSDRYLRATPGLCRLYERWSYGGAGLLITGNLQIDKRVLERPGNVAIDNNGGMRELELWARAGRVGGNHLWMQISHAGRQAPWYVTRRPLAPSPVQLKLLGTYRKPRALSENEIRDLIERWANVAGIAKNAGFTGVQIHAAHGYLLSSFLSPAINRRNDAWGGSLENRARMLLETIRAVRKRVGAGFPVALKLNSADFQKGGFEFDDCLRLVDMINQEGIDLLEISGGSYEQPRLLGYGGDSASADPGSSTARREAYFLKYASEVRRVAEMPIMVTGGFRSRDVMTDAIESGDTDIIGMGRPMCGDPEIARKLLAGEVEEAPRYEQSLKVMSGNQQNPLVRLWPLQVFGQQAWYYMQLFRLARGEDPKPSLKPLACFLRWQNDELLSALLLNRRRTPQTQETPAYVDER